MEKDEFITKGYLDKRLSEQFKRYFGLMQEDFKSRFGYLVEMIQGNKRKL